MNKNAASKKKPRGRVPAGRGRAVVGSAHDLVTLRCDEAVSAKCHPCACECVTARIKALEAVAKAARDHSHAEVDPAPEGEAESCPICRALSRLRAASKGGTR